MGTFNNSHFVYIAAFGIFTDVAYSTPQDMKNVLGNMAYLLEGVKRLANIPSYHLKFSSEECSGEGDFIFGMVTNSRSVGGFKSIIGKNVRFDDGVFEVTFCTPSEKCGRTAGDSGGHRTQRDGYTLYDLISDCPVNHRSTAGDPLDSGWGIWR